METPKNSRQARPSRNPTPRLSERKKSLFKDRGRESSDTSNLLEGIELLDPMSDDNVDESPILTNERHDVKATLRANEDGKKKPATTRKVRVMLPRMSMPRAGKENTPKKSKGADERSPEEQLQELFNSSMVLGTQRRSPRATVADKRDIVVTVANKRHAEATVTGASPKRKVPKVTSSRLSLAIPTKAFYSAPKRSPTLEGKDKKLTSPSTGTFVSISPRSRAKQERRSIGAATINKGVRHKIRRRPRPSTGGTGANHLPSVDVEIILKNIRNEKLRKLIISKRRELEQNEKVRNSKNPFAIARPMSSLGMSDDTLYNNNNKRYSNGLHTANGCDDESDGEFSDIEYCSDIEEVLPQVVATDEVVPLISHQLHEIEAAIELGESEERPKTPLANRKFFKSGHTTATPKEVKITENIRASVCNGKISLVQEKKKVRKRPRPKPMVTNKFADEQATVEEILKNLNDTAFGDIIETIDLEVLDSNTNPSENELQLGAMETVEETPQTDYFVDDMDIEKFRKRLPYNTNDPEIIEQQHLLLDFLITNNICNEENFTIFIADPDNHKEKAARIVDQVILVVNEHSDFQQRLPYNTSEPEVIEHQQRMLDFLIEHDICTEENFDIFIANYNERRHEAAAIMEKVHATQEGVTAITTGTEIIEEAMEDEPTGHHDEIQNPNNIQSDNCMLPKASVPLDTSVVIPNCNALNSEKLFPIFYPEHWKPLEQKSTRRLPRSWTGGEGASQYQLDVGQRDFGAQQCKQCGLVYSVHEPEEEKLHREYHISMHVLRFKGWIDEDIVAINPEWGPDGRILRLTENSHIKRRERLTDILRMVDKELGYSTCVMPRTFVAYLAVRKQQFVGLCVVEPLEKAHKYVCIDGVDCCTKEEHPAKCGISRIWVAPLHRRLHIATKLVQAVRRNTILGIDIPLDQIAFSTPTVVGKLFAQKVSEMENFLVYE